MPKKGIIPFFLLLTVTCLCIEGNAQATSPAETSSAPPSLSQSPQETQPHKMTSPKKRKSRTSRKNKEDFWTHCQKMKGSLYKEDLDDSVYPKDPLLQGMPGVKPNAIPCKFQPDTKSLPGGRAKCSF